MWRISKLLLCALLCLGLMCAGAEDTIISSEDIVVSAANYNTVDVFRGDYISTLQKSAEAVYPLQYTVTYSGADARYVSSSVKRSSEVKKGDVIMTVSVERDEVAIYETELNLTRAREKLEQTLASYDSEINRLNAAAEQETDALLRENLLLNVRIQTLEKQKAEQSAQSEIDALAQRLETLNTQSGLHDICAPADGVISSVTYFKSRESITSGTVIAVMYDPNVVRFSAENESSLLRYGMTVQMTMGSNTDRLEVQGTVVACGNILPGVSEGTDALIVLDGYEETAPESLLRPTFTYTSVYIGRIYAVDPKAVTLESGRYFVYKLAKNGMVSKRAVNYVTAPSGSYGWILLGAELGDTLIIY